MPSGAITLTQQVINSTSPPHFEDTTWVIFSLTFFVSFVSASVQQCMGVLVTLFVHRRRTTLDHDIPWLQQFLHRAAFVTCFGIYCKLLLEGFLLLHTLCKLSQLSPCRTCVWSSVAFTRMTLTQSAKLACRKTSTTRNTGVSSESHYCTPSIIASSLHQSLVTSQW